MDNNNKHTIEFAEPSDNRASKKVKTEEENIERDDLFSSNPNLLNTSRLLTTSMEQLVNLVSNDGYQFGFPQTPNTNPRESQTTPTEATPSRELEDSSNIQASNSNPFSTNFSQFNVSAYNPSQDNTMQQQPQYSQALPNQFQAPRTVVSMPNQNPIHQNFNNINLSLSNNQNNSMNPQELPEMTEEKLRDKVKEILNKYDLYKHNITELEKSQESFCKNIEHQTPHLYDILRTKESGLQQQLEHLLQDSKMLMMNYIMEPADLRKLEELKREMSLSTHQLYIYQTELDYVMRKTMEPPRVAMVVKNQPFPSVVKQKEKKKAKGTKAEDGLSVVLLKGISSDAKVTGEVNANLIYENMKNTGTNSNSIINGTSVFENDVAKFDKLRFPKGTGVKMVRLTFKGALSQSVRGTDNQEHILTSGIESTATEPFVVMTNESQFSDSAMKLLKKAAFLKDSSSPWPHFVNQLQLHYLSATRQSPNDIQRPLSKFDIKYIHSAHFGNKAVVTEDDFKEFWKWFGKVLHKIRHQKPIPELWSKGYIFGFVNKEEATMVLQSLDIGTFLLRFSERSAGQFAVAYVAKDRDSNSNVVKHYLVKPTVKKLQDFLREREAFKTFLVCRIEFNIDGIDNIYKGTIGKDMALGDYYTPADFKSLDGYEEQIN